MRSRGLMMGALLASTFWLCACAPSAEEAEAVETPAVPAGPVGFTYTAQADLEGVYARHQEGAPDTGRFTLTGVRIGAADDFAAWEAGERDRPPVVLILSDAAAARVDADAAADLGAGARLTLTPTAFAVSDRAISVMASSEQTGDLLFEGVISAAALETARSAAQTTGPDDEETDVMTGALSIGGETWRNYRFRWMASGDGDAD